jgi:RNA polymerase sigma-B factor
MGDEMQALAGVWAMPNATVSSEMSATSALDVFAKFQDSLLLLHRLPDGDTGRAALRDEIICGCAPVARRLAMRFRNRGEDVEDLVQVAMIGLIKAVDRFEPDRGVPFGNYVMPTVLGEIKRYFRDKTWAMRVPRGMQELQIEIAKARDKLTTELGRSPTVQEIADIVKQPFEEVLTTIQSQDARRTRSLDEPTGEDVTLADSIGAGDPELGRAEMRVLLDDAFGVLSTRDREVLRLRFRDDLTQTEISKRVGVSQMQVSRIIRQALVRLRADIDRKTERVA